MKKLIMKNLKKYSYHAGLSFNPDSSTTYTVYHSSVRWKDGVLKATFAFGLALIFIVCMGASVFAQAQTTKVTQADAIVAMLKRCEAAMLFGTCSVFQDERFIPADTPPILIPLKGSFPVIDYVRLQNQGGYMCPYAEMQCAKDPKGGVCRIAQALWSAQ